MTTKPKRIEDQQTISVAVAAGKKTLGRLKGRQENIPASGYDDLEAIVEALPLAVDYEEHRRVKAHVANARKAAGAGESSYEIRLATRRLQHMREAAF